MIEISALKTAIGEFDKSHRNAKPKWGVGSNFPDPVIADAYLKPKVPCRLISLNLIVGFISGRPNSLSRELGKPCFVFSSKVIFGGVP